MEPDTEQHPLQHTAIHPRFSIMPPASTLALPTLQRLAGPALPRRLRELLYDNLDQIYEEGSRLNERENQP